MPRRLTHAVATLAPWLLVALIVQTLPLAAAAAPAEVPHHDLIRIEAPGEVLSVLAAAGYDVVGGKPGVEALLVATAADRARLLAAGYRFEIQQADLEEFYADRNGRPTGFGAFHTYLETMDQLDALHTAYPAITTEKYSIGTTGEGRTIWAMKVSDNPDIDENEPEVLFDGLHHAREPMATETCLLLIEYLGSHYDTDPRVHWLVDEREIYFVPVVNPDGYVYNETTYPNGGGLWRKNRRDNGDGSYGVDLNRNYPYEWGGPGSGGIPWWDTYRGPSPGSEPEIQALMNFSLAHQFQTSQSFHVYSNLTLFPWGYTADDCPDDSTLREIASVMASGNGYTYGQPYEILYPVNGGSIDWQYGEQTLKGKTFAYTNEIGGPEDNFWPPDWRIPLLFQDNLEPALYLIEVAGPSMLLRNAAVTGGDGNGRLDAGESAEIALDVQNVAVMLDAVDLTATLFTDDAYLQLEEAQRTVGTLGPRAIWSGSALAFPVTVDGACPTGHVVKLTVRLTWSGGTREAPFDLRVGPPYTLVDDDLEDGTLNWETAAPWGLTTTQSHGPTHSLTDSPDDDYDNYTNASAQLSHALDLTNFVSPTLSFWTRYEMDPYNEDFCYVEASTNQTVWQKLAAYNGIQIPWVQKVIPLDAYVGQPQLFLRWRLQSDDNTRADGWYIDDVAVTVTPAASNVAPTAPVALSPIGGVTVGDPLVLRVQNAVDPDGPVTLTYGFRIYADPLFTQPVWTRSGFAEGADETVWPVMPGRLDPGAYYWRSWADDLTERGPLSAGGAFVYTATSGVADESPRATLSAIPAGNGTSFRFALPHAGRATLALYNLRGEHVATVFEGEVVGATSTIWNQRDTRGTPVASGLYLARLSGPGTELSLKLLVVR